MRVENLGLIDYATALDVQEKAVNGVGEDRRSERLLVCEHFPVVTIGRAQGASEEVFSKNLPVYEVTRGGRATVHMPGQVVVYPILDLEKRGRDLHNVLRVLETSIISTLADFRITSQVIDGKTGVWVENRKIASIGIAARRWVSYHGLALNVDCDLSLFSNVAPCGFSPEVMTSVLREMPEEFQTIWQINHDRLMVQVRARLLENLQEELTL